MNRTLASTVATLMVVALMQPNAFAGNDEKKHVQASAGQGIYTLRSDNLVSSTQRRRIAATTQSDATSNVGATISPAQRRTNAAIDGSRTFNCAANTIGSWFDGLRSCFAEPAATPATAGLAPAPQPQLTAGMVAEAFQRIPVPKERSVSQPGDKTLVNFDTIFYTRAAGFQRTVVLLGQQITLDIAPTSYTWHPGDGTSFTTTSPGAAYPSKTVVHRYTKAHVTVTHSVTINWGARFRVNGGAWAPVPGTVQSTGPGTALRIAEAVPVLTGVSERR